MLEKKFLAIFDLDGTLFDTSIANYESYSHALAKNGHSLKIGLKEFSQICRGRTYLEFLPDILPGISVESCLAIHSSKIEVFTLFLDCIKVNDILFSLLCSIRDTWKIALVTSASKNTTYSIISNFNKFDCFDFILTSDDVTNVKPSSEPFLRAMKLANIPSTRTIVFEDSDVGISAAINSGIDYLQVHGYAI